MESNKIDLKKHGDNYVATKSFDSCDVIAYGKDVLDVYSQAQELGVQDPVINYIPKEGVICIY